MKNEGLDGVLSGTLEKTRHEIDATLEEAQKMWRDFIKSHVKRPISKDSRDEEDNWDKLTPGDKRKLERMILESKKTRWTPAISNYWSAECGAGYPNTRRYADNLKKIGLAIPNKCKKHAWYPFSGLDMLWANIFGDLHMSDINYDRTKDDITHWWPAFAYSKGYVRTLEETFKESGILRRGASIYLHQENGLKARPRVNLAESTAIFKNYDYDLLYKNSGKKMEYGCIITRKKDPMIKRLRGRYKIVAKIGFGKSGDELMPVGSQQLPTAVVMVRKDLLASI